MNIPDLNKKYASLSIEKRIEELFKDYASDDIVFTSSFGTTAGILLYLVNKINPQQAIYFLDTTYHFKETIDYKNELKDLLNLNIVEVLPEAWKNEFTKNDQTWTKDPDLCCSINKVEPMDKLKLGKKIWISGLLAYQNEHRKNLDIFEEKKDINKFYPIIDMTAQEVKDFYINNNIPLHPLQNQGYSSVGCAQCTVKGEGRNGRWNNLNKTECGLHL